MPPNDFPSSMINAIDSYVVPLTLVLKLVRDRREAELLLSVNQELGWLCSVAQRWIQKRDELKEFADIERGLAGYMDDLAMPCTRPLLRRAVTVLETQLTLVQRETRDSLVRLAALAYRSAPSRPMCLLLRCGLPLNIETACCQLPPLSHRVEQCAEINFRVALELDLVPNTETLTGDKRAIASFEERYGIRALPSCAHIAKQWTAVGRSRA